VLGTGIENLSEDDYFIKEKLFKKAKEIAAQLIISPFLFN
jgi:hypothetical protein